MLVGATANAARRQGCIHPSGNILYRTVPIEDDRTMQEIVGMKLRGINAAQTSGATVDVAESRAQLSLIVA